VDIVNKINEFPPIIKKLLYAAAFLLFALLWGFGQYPQFSFIRFFGAIPFIYIILYRKHYLVESILFGTIAYIVNFYWLFITFYYSGKMNPIISSGIVILLCVYYGLQYLIMAFLFKKFYSINNAFLYIFPVIFVFVDFLFPKIFKHSICDGLINFYYFIQVIDITGMTGIILVVMYINIGLFKIIYDGLIKRRFDYKNIIFFIPFLICLIYGIIRVNTIDNEIKNFPVIKAAMIQGNITGKQKMDSSYFQKNINIYNSLTKKAAEEKDIDLIIWPESVFNRAYDGTQKSLKRLIFENYPPLILGITYWKEKEYEPEITNSCFLIKNQNAVLRYDKKHLLVFGEYIPFEKHIPILRYITPLNYSLKKGNTSSIFNIDNKVKACMSICFEDIFPDEIRKKVSEGSNLMINITNDSWYGNTIGPVHHSVIARLRAIENRRSFYRCTATGVTTASDPTGRVIATGKVWTEQIVTASLALYDKRTIYSYIGEIFSYLCIVLTILLFIIIIFYKIYSKILKKISL